MQQLLKLTKPAPAEGQWLDNMDHSQPSRGTSRTTNVTSVSSERSICKKERA